MKKIIVAVSFLVLAALLLTGSSLAGEKQLMMATTTSTDNTGLLDYLMPRFKAAAGIEVKWTATGTGKALKLGENCDVDILMVHAPAAEKKFMDHGFGAARHEIMANDFVIIGPEKDKAGIKGKSVKDALQTIQSKQAVFVSRGDNSGTNRKELHLWQAADLPIPEKENWYIQSGQGMLSTINIASERSGYTLTDRGTYIKYSDNLGGNPPLKIMVAGDTALLNQYSVIAINKAHCPQARYDLARQFIDWISGDTAQQLIGDFKLLGKPLFTPNAKK